MQLITHRSHQNALPASPIKAHIAARFNQLSEDTDVPPNIVLVEENNDITGPDYAFVGCTSSKHVRGLPLTGLENPRPAVQKAGDLRMNAEDLPFDPKDLLKHEFPYDPSMENWGGGG